jgi:hypothetical protein
MVSQQVITCSHFVAGPNERRICRFSVLFLHQVRSEPALPTQLPTFPVLTRFIDSGSERNRVCALFDRPFTNVK